MYPNLKNFSELLVKESYLTTQESNQALAHSSSSEEYVQYLITNELITLTLIGQAIAEYLKLEFADLSNVAVSTEDIEKIDEDFARKYRVVFVRESAKEIVIASDNPKAVELKPLQKKYHDKSITVVYTLPDYVDERFNHYQQSLPTRFSEIIRTGKSVAPELVAEILKDAIRYNASDIHFEPEQDTVAVRFRVDGYLRKAGDIPKLYYENVLNRIKVESGMRIDEHFMAQDGAIQYTLQDQQIDLRISLVPTVRGEKIVIRVLGSYIQSFSLSDIGLGTKQQTKIIDYANRPFGMILTVGPTGSGKTTTLYALLKLLNKPDTNVTTIEDPVEYHMAGVNQIQVQEQADMTFSKGLRAIVRQDPDIILVGEIRDRETAEISINAALTGHLLLSTFHANDAATAVPRLIDMGIEPFLLASTLELIVAQRLVRKLCTFCRYSESFADATKDLANAASLSKYFLKTDTFYAAKGCNNCNGTGYKGRLGLFEFLEITPEMQELIITSPSAQDIEKLARRQSASTMFSDALDKVKSGQTTIREVLRVVLPTTHKRT